MSPNELVAAALHARTNAYVPYSQFPVGAAVLTADGAVFEGCNVENAAYPSTICAERVALTSAVAPGQTRLCGHCRGDARGRHALWQLSSSDGRAGTRHGGLHQR